MAEKREVDSLMEQTNMLSEIEQLAWAGLVSKSIANAISGLSDMVGRTVEVRSLTPRVVDITEVPDLFGGPEAVTVGVYLKVSGAASGHILLVHQPQAAFEMLDMLLGEPVGTTQILGEMEESALGEMGNVMGSFFLNALADSTGLSFYPSPPAVMMDMAGAVLDAALAEMMMEADDVCIVEATFGTDDQQVNGTFLAMPSPELLQAVVRQWGSGQ